MALNAKEFKQLYYRPTVRRSGSENLLDHEITLWIAIPQNFQNAAKSPRERFEITLPSGQLLSTGE